MKEYIFTDLVADIALQAVVEASSQEEARMLVKTVLIEALTGVRSRGVHLSPDVIETYYGGVFLEVGEVKEGECNTTMNLTSP